MNYNDENSLSCVITICYLSAGFPSVSAGFALVSAGFPSVSAGFPSVSSGFPSVSSGFPSVSARNNYDVAREEKCGKAYMDYLFKPKRKGFPTIILELKYDHSAKDAIEQVKKS